MVIGTNAAAAAGNKHRIGNGRRAEGSEPLMNADNSDFRLPVYDVEDYIYYGIVSVGSYLILVFVQIILFKKRDSTPRIQSFAGHGFRQFLDSCKRLLCLGKAKLREMHGRRYCFYCINNFLN
jgi:hypothetical protein